MNTITISNKVRKVANKFNIKIENLNVRLTPSWNYGEDSTNDEFVVEITISNPDTVSMKRARKFICEVEYICNKDWKYTTEAYITNKDID